MSGFRILLPILLSISFSSRAGVTDRESATGIVKRPGVKMQPGIEYRSSLDRDDDWLVIKMLCGSLVELRSLGLSANEFTSEGIIAGIKSYAKSEQFKAAYRRWREFRRPSASTMTAVEIAGQRKELNAAITLHRQIMRNCFDCSERETSKMNESIYVLQERLELLHAPDPAIAIWERKYPENSDLLIANLLKTFIDITTSVDFNAGVKRNHDNISFINPYYEQKNYLWKFCFHAGKETTDTLRKLAIDWLREISDNHSK